MDLHTVSNEYKNPFQQRYEKHLIALRYFLIGRQFITASEALTFGSRYHTGFRKDGATPEFFHQVSIAAYIRTLPVPEDDLETLITAALLHDVVEDYDVDIDTIERMFGQRVAQVVFVMTNHQNGVKLPKEVYYVNLSEDPLGAITKGCDRMHNIQTMAGVFSEEKQKEYVHETFIHVIPMLKRARRNFPAYEAAFENLKRVLEIQAEMVNNIYLHT